MNPDWLIGIAVFLPLFALVLPASAIVPAIVIGFACAVAWTIAIRDEL